MDRFLLPVPLVVIGSRDARWLVEVLAGRWPVTALPPNLAAACAELAAACQVVATSGQSTPDPLLTVAQAAKVLGVSPRTVRRRNADGAIPAVHVGRLVRVHAADVHGAAS